MAGSSLTVLPPKLAGNPSIQKITHALAATKMQNRDLREQAQQAQSPIAQTVATQAGAAGAAALTVFVPKEKAPLAIGAASALALVYGLVNGQPVAISVANGLLTPLTYAKVVDLLSREKNASASKSSANKSKSNEE